MTDTGAYSDVVFGLFRLLGYRFSPRLADVGGTRFWRIDPKADYGLLNSISMHQLSLKKIIPYWDDILRLAGSRLSKYSNFKCIFISRLMDSSTQSIIFDGYYILHTYWDVS